MVCLPYTPTHAVGEDSAGCGHSRYTALQGAVGLNPITCTSAEEPPGLAAVRWEGPGRDPFIESGKDPSHTCRLKSGGGLVYNTARAGTVLAEPGDSQAGSLQVLFVSLWAPG